MHIAKFTRALRVRLLDTASGFGKAYLNLLVDEIRLDGNELRIKGSYRALARAITLSREAKPDAVPSFVPEWRPHGDCARLALPPRSAHPSPHSGSGPPDLKMVRRPTKGTGPLVVEQGFQSHHRVAK